MTHKRTEAMAAGKDDGSLEEFATDGAAESCVELPKARRGGWVGKVGWVRNVRR